MAKQSLLLVDGDARSLRVLEVSLKKAGFNVTTAVNGRDALDKVQTAAPDLIISDTEMPEMDGFAFCEELKSQEQWADIPFIFLTKESSIENKIRGLELGVEDYLTKPIYIKEILTRIRILLQKSQRASIEAKRDTRTRFSGRISDLGVVDLIQTIELNRKSGLIQITADDDHRAVVYFRDGKVIDAEAGVLQGADAVYRVLTWSDGEFEVFFRNVRRKDVISISAQALLMEGMRRLDEWGRLLEQLPPLDTVFVVDTFELAELLADLPDELNTVLKLFDGRRTLLEITDASEYGDLKCLEAIAKLYFEGLIIEESEGTPDQNIEDDSGMFARQVSRLTSEVGARATSTLPLPGTPRAPMADDPTTRASSEIVEHTISDAELDLADVDVATKPQTSLVEAAIGAATPVVSNPIEPTPRSPAPREPMAAPTPAPEVAPSHRAARQSDVADAAPGALPGTPIQTPEPAAPDDAVPTEIPPSESSPINVVTSEGQEVATASGEFRISEIEERGAQAPAREFVTIKPSRGDTQDGIRTRQPEDTPEQLPSGKRRTRRSVTTDPGIEPVIEPAHEPVPESLLNPPPADVSSGASELDRIAATLDAAMSGAETSVGASDAPPGGIDIDVDSDDTSGDPAERTLKIPKTDQPRLAVGPIPDPDAPPLRGYGWLLVAIGVLIVVVLVVLIVRGLNKSPSTAPAASADAAPIVHDAGPTTPHDAGAVHEESPRDAATDAAADAAVPDAAPEPPDAASVVAEDRALYDQARSLRRKDPDKALELIEQAIAINASRRYTRLQAEIHANKADTFEKEGEYEAALDAADKAIDASSRYAPAWFRKGTYHFMLNDTAAARKAFERYIELKPKGAKADEARALLEEL